MDVRSFLKSLSRIIFPPICVSCRRKIPEGVLCAECRSSVEVRNGFTCPKCNRRLPPSENASGPTNFCHPETKFVLAAASSYEITAVRELLHFLKYHSAMETREPLSVIIAEYARKAMRGYKKDDFIIIPTPLHPRREKKRGFNQARLIAEILSGELGLVIQNDNLIRIRNTVSQTKSGSYEERRKNVSGCFALRKPELITGRNIILVDDVFTSGATMRESVKILKEGGARKIIGFVVAKT